METTRSTLLPAGLAAGASLAFGAAGLVIALIAALMPPVSEFMSPALNASEAARVRWLWIGPAMVLVMGVWALAQVVLRRPLLTREEVARRWPTTRSTIAVAVFAGGVVVLLALGGFVLSLGVLQDAAARSITDTQAFSGLGMGLGICGVPFAVLSGLLLLRSWKGARA